MIQSLRRTDGDRERLHHVIHNGVQLKLTMVNNNEQYITKKIEESNFISTKTNDKLLGGYCHLC